MKLPDELGAPSIVVSAGGAANVVLFDIYDAKFAESAFEVQKLQARISLGPSQNIFALDDEDFVLWQVQAPTEPEPEVPHYVGLWRNETSALMAQTWHGNVYKIDEATGEVKFTRWLK